MTLLVHTFVYDEPGKPRLLDDPEDGSDMAGFESSRTKLWGSEHARALGARFLPGLAADDLYVQPEDIEEFLAECELLRGHTAELGVHSGYREDYVAARLADITRAALRAGRWAAESWSGERRRPGRGERGHRGRPATGGARSPDGPGQLTRRPRGPAAPGSS